MVALDRIDDNSGNSADESMNNWMNRRRATGLMGKRQKENAKGGGES